MTNYHKKQAEKRYMIDGYICKVCGKRANQLAHRIARTKINIKRHTEQVINHNMNLVPVCSLPCNSKVNIGNCHLQTITDLVYYIDLFDSELKKESLTTEKINKLLGIEW